MPIDPQKLVAMAPIVTRQAVTPRDVILYALGVGATELDFVYERRLKALPTFAAVLAYPGFVWMRPEIGADWKRMLQGEQSVAIHETLPVDGTVRGETIFRDVVDKGADKGAIVYVERAIFDDATNVRIATARMTAMLRGDGGRGGTTTETPEPHPLPARRAPDHVVTEVTAPGQALLYRLSGDWNPLHVDPAVAAAAGFDRPVLHGLCGFGIAGRALLRALAGNEPARLTRIDCRFTAPVYPGETIRTEIWREDGGSAAFRASVVERDSIVMTHGYAELR